jgi:hypothetical protein
MRRNLAQHGIGSFGNTMQRSKASMLILAVQPQR